MKKFLKWIGGGFLILIVLSALFGSGNSEKTSSSPTPPPIQKTEVKQESSENKPIAVGVVGGDDLDMLKDNRVNVFKSPERNNGLAGKIPNRSKVEVYEVKDLDGYKVYRIKYGKVEGWVGENVIKIKE